LLELLISIAILSTGIVIILQGFTFSARAAALSSDLIQAVFLAKDKLQSLEFKENNGLTALENPDNRTTVGKFHTRFLNELNKDLSLYTFNAEISWKRSKREEKITAQTYLR
jgi:hypothetical protein